MALSAHALIRGWDVTPHGLSLWGWQGWGEGKRLRPGEVAARLGHGGWLQALLLGARLLHTSISPLPDLGQHPDQVLEAGFISPHAPLGFVLPCVLLLLVFPSRAAALLLTLSLPALGLTDAGLPWSCLSPGPSQALLLRPGTPFPEIASAAHFYPPYFV